MKKSETYYRVKYINEALELQNFRFLHFRNALEMIEVLEIDGFSCLLYQYDNGNVNIVNL